MTASPLSGPIFRRLEVLEEVDSTNDYLKRCVHCREARVVSARVQTAGRGRYGRGWYSPAGQGLYVSYLFYPDWEASEIELLNVIPSLAVVALIRSLEPSLDVHLKRPNDVLIGRRKVAGILAELASTGSRIDWAVVGIGINVGPISFPADLSGATSLKREGITEAELGQLRRRLTAEMETRIQLAGSPERGILYDDYQQETE